MEYIVQTYYQDMDMCSDEYNKISEQMNELRILIDKNKKEMNQLTKETDAMQKLNHFNEFCESIGMKEYGYRDGCHDGSHQKKLHKTRSKMVIYLLEHSK